MVKKSTSWGKVAGWYDQLLEENDDTYQEQVIKPNLLRILSAKSGEEILDLGCGQGFFARELGKLGGKILGVDIAGELIKLAKEKAGPNEKYLVLSAEHLANIASDRFDAAICVLALQNIKNLSLVISELSRVLKPGGRTVIVLNHPSFRVPTATSWGYDEKENVQYRRIDKYLSEITQQVDMSQGEKHPGKKIFTYSFHRPLQSYFKAFAKAGLAVVRLEEWVSHKTSDTGARKAAEDRARKEIPLFMCLELQKAKDSH